MFATHNYMADFKFRRLLRLTLALCFGFPICEPGWSDEPHPAHWGEWLAHAQSALIVARQKLASTPIDNNAAAELGRAIFDRAEFATNDTERAALATQGIEVSRKLISRDPKSAPGHYYLGMNLGQLARTKSLGALKLVDEMEREFKIAELLDEKFDRAGPDRNLGLLYHEAPVIGSIGSRSKAHKYLERAAELAPDFPENRLNLAEASLKWREKKPLKRELDALQALWPAAKTNFTGLDWAATWHDWEQRKQALSDRAKAVLGK